MLRAPERHLAGFPALPDARTTSTAAARRPAFKRLRPAVRLRNGGACTRPRGHGLRFQGGRPAAMPRGRRARVGEGAAASLFGVTNDETKC